MMTPLSMAILAAAVLLVASNDAQSALGWQLGRLSAKCQKWLRIAASVGLRPGPIEQRRAAWLAFAAAREMQRIYVDWMARERPHVWQRLGFALWVFTDCAAVLGAPPNGPDDARESMDVRCASVLVLSCWWPLWLISAPFAVTLTTPEWSVRAILRAWGCIPAEARTIIQTAYTLPPPRRPQGFTTPYSGRPAHPSQR